MTVADIARTDPVTTPPSTPIDDVARLLRDESVGCVVVTEGDDPRGIVTDRDIAVRITADNLDPEQMTAGDVMTETPVTVDVSAGVVDLCDTMATMGVRRVPVVEGGDLVGIVTLDDLVVLLATELSDLADVVRSESPPY